MEWNGRKSGIATMIKERGQDSKSQIRSSSQQLALTCMKAQHSISYQYTEMVKRNVIRNLVDKTFKLEDKD